MYLPDVDFYALKVQAEILLQICETFEVRR